MPRPSSVDSTSAAEKERREAERPKLMRFKPRDFTSIILYGCNTGLCFVINVGLTAFLHEILAAPEELAYAVSLIAVLAVSFLFMRTFVYRAGSGPIGEQVVRYLVSAWAFRGLEYAAFLAAHTWLGFHYLGSIIVINTVSSITKYFYYKKAVFILRRGTSGRSA